MDEHTAAIQYMHATDFAEEKEEPAKRAAVAGETVTLTCIIYPLDCMFCPLLDRSLIDQFVGACWVAREVIGVSKTTITS